MSRRTGRGLWVTNHLANPVMRTLLRGPFGRRAGRRLALLRYRGRRTGRVYELPVQYARHGTLIWIVPGSPERKTWWRNLGDGADVDLRLAGHDVHGHAVALDGGRQPEEVAAGLAAYLRALPRAGRAFGVPAASAREATPRDVRELGRRAVLVRVDLDR